MAIVDGEPTEFARAQLDRYRRRVRSLIWGLVGFVVLLIAATTVLVVVVGHHGSRARSSVRTPVWQEVTGLSISAAGTVVLVVALVRYFRSGAWGAAFRSPAIVLTRRQRRQLLKTMTGRAPLETDRVRVGRHVAGRFCGSSVQLLLTLFITGMVLEVVGQLINHPSTGRLIYTGFALVLFAVAFANTVRRRRQLQRFLDQTRAPA